MNDDRTRENEFQPDHTENPNQAAETPRNFDEEFAAEAVEKPYIDGDRDREEARDRDGEQEQGRGLAVTGLVFSIISLFFLTFLFAPIGIVIGFLAARTEARRTAYWAIGIGIASLLGAILFEPFFG